MNILLILIQCLAGITSLLISLNCLSETATENRLLNFSRKSSVEYLSTTASKEIDELTLKHALQLALEHNSELAAFAKEIRALDGITLQVGLLPNPDLSVNVENLGNVNSLHGDINSQKNVAQEIVQQLTTIRISQLIELGGKRAARISAATLGKDVAVNDFEMRRIDLVAQVANAFTEVLVNQEQLSLAIENQKLAQILVNTVSKRVQAGKASPIEETKVEIAFSAAQIALTQAQRDLSVSRKRLIQFCGNSFSNFDKSVGNLESLIAIPSFDSLLQRALVNPMALRAIKSIEQRKSLLEVEKTRRIPNLTVSAGAVHHAAIGGSTPVISMTMPLPLFNRNQGSIKEAHERLEKSLDEQAAIELKIKTDLAQAYETFSAAQSEVNILRNRVIPGAKSAFEVTKKGYQIGKFGLIELLDAQRTLFQNQVLYLRALTNYQLQVNEIERLIGGPIDLKTDRTAYR